MIDCGNVTLNKFSRCFFSQNFARETRSVNGFLNQFETIKNFLKNCSFILLLSNEHLKNAETKNGMNQQFVCFVAKVTERLVKKIEQISFDIFSRGT